MIVLSIICFILTSLLIVSVYASFRLFNIVSQLENHIEQVNDTVEESLDKLDENYQTLVKITSMEVFSDEPVVRQMLSALEESRIAVGEVAIKLASSVMEAEDEQQDTDQSDDPKVQDG